jgi:uncharacterized protein YecT (DUF1311 family)
MLRVLLFVLATMLPVAAFSQNNANDSVDLKLERCLNDSFSTAGQCNCIRSVMDYWNKQLNSNYKLLIKTLSPSNKEFLKNAQREWILYRDKEFEWIDKLYYDEMQGTMYYPMAEYKKMEFVKKRALELIDYINLLKER